MLLIPVIVGLIVLCLLVRGGLFQYMEHRTEVNSKVWHTLAAIASESWKVIWGMLTPVRVFLEWIFLFLLALLFVVAPVLVRWLRRNAMDYLVIAIYAMTLPFTATIGHIRRKPLRP